MNKLWGILKIIPTILQINVETRIHKSTRLACLGLELPGCSAQDAIRDTLTIHRDPALAACGVGNFITDYCHFFDFKDIF